MTATDKTRKSSENTRKTCQLESGSSTEFKATVVSDEAVFDKISPYMTQEESWVKKDKKDNGASFCKAFSSPWLHARSSLVTSAAAREAISDNLPKNPALLFVLTVFHFNFPPRGVGEAPGPARGGPGLMGVVVVTCGCRGGCSPLRRSRRRSRPR